MKYIFTIICFGLSLFCAQAHPGIGIVYDGNQTIYYTDLNHVWKLDIKSTIAEILIEDIHTHELAIDNEGKLYGEHYWYIETEESFKNYIWRYSKEGVFEIIREAQEGGNYDFSFVRDTSFAEYEIRKINGLHQIIKTDSLTEKVVHQLKLISPTWKYITEDNNLLFVDYPDIYVANEQDIKILAQDVSSSRFPFSLQSDEHSIYGIWADKNDDIFVAIYGGRQVKRMDDSGSFKPILNSSFQWSPVNGVFDNDNNLWLMECKVGGKIRVRKINSDQLNGDPSFLIENMIIALVLVAGGLTIFRIKSRKKLMK